ncbi:TetR/AcrR family transcriptional regulator [Bacillus sp. CGMCC 1.16607]|uniref:TetR/AcrR family transcriptional regulator n=1 Tax=Bacillus sp. CGMCC 1.16607 TaxID=3351842 RepID=UPI00362E2BCB
MRKGLDKLSVLQAAGDMVDQYGFDQISLASLAKSLQIKTPSLYNHVDGLPGLKKELAGYAIGKLKETLIISVIGKSGEEALYAIGNAYVEFVRNHPGLYEATMAKVVFTDSKMIQTADEIVQLILKVLEVFHLQKDDALHMVRGLRSIVHGFASLELKNGFNIELSKDESFKQILQTFVCGIKTRRLGEKV